MTSRRRGRRSEARSRRREVKTRRRSDVSRRRRRRIIIPRRRRGRRDVNRARIGRVKEGTASEVQRNTELGGFRLGRNAQRSDRDGADEKRSSERASETAFDGNFHRVNPRKVGKRRSRAASKERNEKSTEAPRQKRRERFSLLYASSFRFDAPIGEKSPEFFDFARNFSLRRRKLASTNALGRENRGAVDKKSRRSNRERFERRRFDV